jgi:hypothetical protein
MSVDESALEALRKQVGDKLNSWGSRIQVSMHYKPKVVRQDGERWTENDKTWVMKGGVAQNISITQDAKMPWWCPRCSKTMNHRFDRKFYFLRGWCYDCNVNIEGEMRLNGTYEAFERQMMRANEVAFLKDKIEEKLSYIREFKPPTVYFENGGYEVIAKRETFEPLFADLMTDVDFMLNRLEQIRIEDESENESIEKSV